MKIQFICLGSGSSGNCFYLGTERCGVLIDAGIAARTIKKHLKEAGIDIEKLRGVLVTHDHADHIKALGSLGEKLHIPIYTTSLVHQGIARSYCMTERLITSARTIEKEQPFELGDFCIECFEVPHDGTDNVGYCIQIGQTTFTFLTDLGEITPTAARYIDRANYLIIEANYDTDMLHMGPYPHHLKERIASSTGHMSNADTARYLAHHLPPHVRHIWLCHLSKDNNHPELALKTVELALRDQGILVGKELEVTALKRTTPSPLYELVE